VLLTTHYMEEADALCDRVALMHRGQLRAMGTPTKLKAQISKVSSHATLEDVFRHYAASDLSDQTESSRSFREIRSSRKVASRAS
jgi:ABC-2 type transport system ATP-binding protein